METKVQSDRWHSTATGVTVVGLGVNLALAAAKLAAGVVFGSQAILADGLHSLSDLATDLAVLAGIRISNRPADEDHHYGHRRAMTLVTALLGAVLLAAGAVIGYRAIRAFHERFYHEAAPVQPFWPLVIAIVSIVLKEALYQATARVGRRSGDTSVIANAWHHRTDAFSSVAAAAGLAAVALGGPGWQYMDCIVAMVLASFLVVVAGRIMWNAFGEMMDRAPSAKQTARIEQVIAATDGVESFHAFRARRLGGVIEMDIHVQVDPDLSVRRGHEIAGAVKQRVMSACPEVATVIVHVEPAEQ